MSDFVSIQAVIALAKDIVVPTNKGEYRHRCIDPYDVYELRPTDVEPVVRCKDCEFYTEDERWCRRLGLCGAFDTNDYCSHAERREE